MENGVLPAECHACPLVCRCLQITEHELLETLANKDVQTLKDLRRLIGAGDGCTACHPTLKRYLEHYAFSSPICSVK